MKKKKVKEFKPRMGPVLMQCKARTERDRKNDYKRQAKHKNREVFSGGYPIAA